MCGIGGIVRYGQEEISMDMINILLLKNEHRGNDASGVAIAKIDGSIEVYKKDEKAWTFVGSEGYRSFMAQHLTPDTWAVIVHTRAATKGNPRDNVNNHPLTCGKSAIIHNGIINNDDHVFRQQDMKRTAVTDSDVLRGIVDKFGITPETVKIADSLSGSVACAAVTPEAPQRLLLMRSGSPICLASTKDFFLFASEKDTLHAALRPLTKRFGIWFQIQKPDAAFSKMADNSAWIIGAEGLEWHGEFKTCYHYTEPNRRVYEDWKERQKRFDAAKPAKVEKDEAYCQPCKKDWLIPKGAKPQNFYCDKDQGGCGKPLSPRPALNIVH